ncbi:type III pantothenate kinase [Cupriavidus neocaledonicus]|uniref:Type III pantothenate kinase n=1 Tax=Cupriavidus neocaledonicus TaxID=1040979 RepID=A0A375H4V2_9BURK|nr:type III pantothenate kinase [Cupriavidus neocaledonicus]SOZ34260.1 TRANSCRIPTION REGULATION ACCESSORY FACTOR, similar to B.pertussis bvg [Cupriavidus neocaledonicus]SPD45170.1 Type III pantothenate kinase [Cupriavidus neocaledonicus]
MSPPRLLVDIGNTRLKWAWCDAAAEVPASAGIAALPTPWQHAGAVAHAGHGALRTLAAELRALRASGPMPSVWISNVAGPVIAAAVDAALADAFGGCAPVQWVRSTAAHGDLANGYREPTQLGVDRWTGAVGAHRWLPRDTLLVVTAGTATTLDIVTVTDDGARFEGGLILPGLALMLGTLARNTAQLPALDVGEAGSVAGAQRRWADNTHDAIAAGCLAAQAGAIERTWRALGERGDASRPPRCLLSGGARGALAGALAVPFEMHDNLVLLGLHAMATPEA